MTKAMMWRDIRNGIPEEDGLYVVARFEGDKLLEYNLEYAKLDGYFGPNKLMGGLNRVNYTHWMRWVDFRELLRCCEREEYHETEE